MWSLRTSEAAVVRLLLAFVMIPDLLYTRAIVVRAAALWLGVRLSIGALGLPKATFLLPIGPVESALVVGTIVALSALELRRRGEFLLLANLGSAPQTLLLLAGATVLPLEIAFSATILALR